MLAQFRARPGVIQRQKKVRGPSTRGPKGSRTRRNGKPLKKISPTFEGGMEAEGGDKGRG